MTIQVSLESDFAFIVGIDNLFLNNKTNITADRPSTRRLQTAATIPELDKVPAVLAAAPDELEPAVVVAAMPAVMFAAVAPSTSTAQGTGPMVGESGAMTA
ncbi:hypothetical protein NKR19_g271 [Coniochaeta hoffmannii]|uniref:Uncharacterized protein n=1 Tax=Coniochaeta hoffmannii TaxID=91930 RepID=A0AA38VU38_9PEZI|nr:hypothetical protein NKR19_g271 [Coniochaeta hoffmannii]